MELASYISQNADVPVYILLQSHLWYDRANNHMLKEPTKMTPVK